MKAMKVIILSPFILGAMVCSVLMMIFAALTSWCCKIVDSGLEP